MFYQYCSWDKVISFLDLKQVPWCFTIYYEELQPQNTKIQATLRESCIAARPSSDMSNFSLFIWMRLFLLTHWSQDVYFKFKIHFLTLEDLPCSITENASMLQLLQKITLSPSAFEKDMASDPKGTVNMIILIHVQWNKVEVKGNINRTSTTRLKTPTR